ncbi:hypothetical protein B0F87_104281 [Methylobacter tundripaludum]|uniref:Uncharacterized protein n=1 Tax=Methylobacter tundripaludum TaxID=173365 RepID=A0A2S6HFB9_9GAMM|nr:hypothetical protein [Methylobacter tundripaludum]PPK76189.1 hypothetical protein B0F87_104281 [Methylobacter tundripaludum]
MKTSLTGIQIWGMPVLLGLVSVSGLIAALLFDGIGDAVSWLALAAPVVTALWYGVRHT